MFDIFHDTMFGEEKHTSVCSFYQDTNIEAHKRQG